MEADPLQKQKQVQLSKDEIEEKNLKGKEEEDDWFEENESDLSYHDENDEDDQLPQEGKLSIPIDETIPPEQPKHEVLEIPQDKKIKQAESYYCDFDSYNHHVDYNYLVLLIVLSGHRMVNLREISEMQVGYIELISKERKIVVKTTSEKAANDAIDKISTYIDSLSILKLDMRGETADCFSNFKKLKDYLRKDGIVMFGSRFRQVRQLYIGGVMKPSELRTALQRIKTIRVRQAFLRTLKNTRSYKLVVDEILGMESMQHQLEEFNQVKFAEVDRRNRQKELRVTFGTICKKEYTGNDYENFLMKHLRNYCVVAFCYHATQKYLEKPKVENVAFKFISERAVKKSYMYVIALKEDMVARKEQIKAQVEKLGERIIGVRVFFHLFPNLHDFAFRKDHYYFFKYPMSRPYSISVFAKTREGHKFNWQHFFKRLVELCEGKEGGMEIIE